MPPLQYYLFVCLYRPWILHPEWIIPFFRDLVSSPRCLALVTHLLPGDDLHQPRDRDREQTLQSCPAQGSNLVPKQMPGTSAGFKLSSASKGIRIRTQSHRPMQALARFSPDVLWPFLAYSLIPSGEAIIKISLPSILDYSTRHGCQTQSFCYLGVKLLYDRQLFFLLFFFLPTSSLSVTFNSLNLKRHQI